MGSHSTTAAPHSAITAPRSRPSTTWSTDDPFTRDLAQHLAIPLHLVAEAKHLSLLQAYEHYKECTAALARLEHWSSDATWGDRKPIGTDDIQLFIGKTTWYHSWVPLFSKVKDYEDLQKWLEGAEDASTGSELFGLDKHSYTFGDLTNYFSRTMHKAKVGLKQKMQSGQGEGGKAKKAKRGSSSRNPVS